MEVKGSIYNDDKWTLLIRPRHVPGWAVPDTPTFFPFPFPQLALPSPRYLGIHIYNRGS